MPALFFPSFRLECMKPTIFFCLFFLLSFGLKAQDLDTIPVPADTPIDTLEVPEPDSLEKKKGPFYWFSESYPNPKKALILSAIPGGGQAYNKRFWKMPIVYAALGGMIYLIDQNSTEYLYYKRAYRRKVRGLPHDLSGEGGLDSPNVLKNYRDQADKNTQLSYIGFVAVYALSGVEAFVDAHLRDFDVSEDLSLQLVPTREMGIGLRLEF